MSETPVVMVETAFKQNAEQALAGVRDVQEKFRVSVEQSMHQGRSAYEKIKVAAEEATGSLETSYAAATRGFSELNAKAIAALRAHSEATFAHLKALTAAKTLPEAITLQSEHTRKQFEAFATQARELAEMAQKVAADSAEPIKATFTKRFAA